MSALPQAVRDWLAQQPSSVVQSFMLDLASRREGDSTTGSIHSLPEAEEPPAPEPKAVPAREPWEPPTEEEQALFFNTEPAQPSDEDLELQPAEPDTKPEPPQPSPSDDTELIKALESCNLIDLETPIVTSPAPAFAAPQAAEVAESYVAIKAMPKPPNKLTDGAQTTRFNKQHAPPTASALPKAEPLAPPPGEDIWWTSRPISDILSPRHQPKPEGDYWKAWDGSWWANCWGLEGNKPPPDATRWNREHWAYSLDPAYYKGNRIWVHPRRAIHDQPPSMAPPLPTQPTEPTQPPQTTQPSQPSQPEEQPAVHQSRFPPIMATQPEQPSFITNQPPTWCYPGPEPEKSVGFDLPGQSLPSHIYSVGAELRALRQLHQGYSILVEGEPFFAPRTMRNAKGAPMFGYIDDNNHLCCAEPCGTQPICPNRSLCGAPLRNNRHLSRHLCSRCHERERHGLPAGPIA